MTASARSSAWRNVDAIRSKLSPTLVWNIESMPASASFAPIHDEFVSTIWPSSSSVPTATTSQRMGGTLSPRRRGAPGPAQPAEAVTPIGLPSGSRSRTRR